MWCAQADDSSSFDDLVILFEFRHLQHFLLCARNCVLGITIYRHNLLYRYVIRIHFSALLCLKPE